MHFLNRLLSDCCLICARPTWFTKPSLESGRLPCGEHWRITDFLWQELWKGLWKGLCEGFWEGLLEGLWVGLIVGVVLGNDVGDIEGDRVELYRPLKIDPKQARLNRAKKKDQAQ